ncbi:MAG TPA: hypothetical protein EYQ50_13080 [Verrucomicrobiales bacterium]|nr:hypothetical protein [Verrucomicrobiales bacterium]
MEIKCPACRKSNDVSLSDSSCVRCGCNLEKLANVMREALSQLNSAAKSLRSVNWQEALNTADSTWNYRHSPMAARIAFLAAVALNQTEQAILWKARLGKET